MKNVFKLTVIGFLLSAQAAFACSCDEWGTPAEMLKRNHAVFLGVASSDSVRVGYDPDIGGGPLMRTKFSVIKGFKNVPGKVVYIRGVQADGANCGADFKKDDGLWLVLAFKNSQDKLETSSCALNKINNESSYKFLRELNKL